MNLFKYKYYLFACFLSFLLSCDIFANKLFEQEGVFYSKKNPDTPLTNLINNFKKNPNLFKGNTSQEILKELLNYLNIPIESQILVYSKTSFQNSKISPSRPRAIYFSDNAYVGWVQGGDIEIVTFDRNLGSVFHILNVNKNLDKRSIKLVRDTSCLSCHADSSYYDGTPKVLARSVFPSNTGEPILKAGTFQTDYRSPFSERWGGWYVTGKVNDEVEHMGNIVAKFNDSLLDVEIKKIASNTCFDLAPYFDSSPYLNKGKSDIIALMIFEHQIFVHNALTKGNIITKVFQYKENKINEPSLASSLSNSRKIIIDDHTKKIVDSILFKDEFSLTGIDVEGDFNFQKEFLKTAKKTKSNRSLKDLRLHKRIFKYRCSYMVYSDVFMSLNTELKKSVIDLLTRVLKNPKLYKDYKYLSKSESEKIINILKETHPDFKNI